MEVEVVAEVIERIHLLLRMMVVVDMQLEKMIFPSVHDFLEFSSWMHGTIVIAFDF